MDILKKIVRVVFIVIAALVIVLGVVGIFGSWYVNRVATDVTIKAFSVVDTGVIVAQTGVERVNGLVQDGRTEVQQAEQNIVTVSNDLQANSPVLTALSERLHTRLAPTVEKITAALEPVRGALSTANTMVGVLNAIPSVRESSPNLVKLDNAFNELEQLSADIQQLDSTLSAAVVGEKNALTQEVTTVLTDLTTRIDTRLSGVQSEIESLLNEILVLQGEIAALRSRLLLIYNLSALAATLFLIWLIYSQVVVIRHQWRLVRGSAAPAVAVLPALEPANVAMVDDPVSVLPETSALIDSAADTTDTEEMLAVAAAATPEADESDEDETGEDEPTDFVPPA